MTIHMRLAELVVIRHGRTEANEAIDRANQHGDHSLLNAIRHKPEHGFILLPEGHAQARRGADWIDQHVGTFDAYLTSRMVRAHQSGDYVSLPQGKAWVRDHRLDERLWGRFGTLSTPQKDAERPGWKDAKQADPLNFNPGDGAETLALLHERWLSLWRDINAHHADGRVLIVGHGENLQIGQMVIERLSAGAFAFREKELRLGNSCIVRYRRFPSGVYRQHIDPHAGVVSAWVPVHHH